jgi:hypothetical protein
MTAQQTQRALMGLMGVLIIVLAYIVGALLMRDGRHPVAPPPPEARAESVAEPRVANATGPVTPEAMPAGEARAASRRTAAIVMSPPVELTAWTVLQHGCDVEQTDRTVHIRGLNDADGWNRENGVEGTEYPVQDFDASMDFMVPQAKGDGWASVILRARESDYSQVTLHFDIRGGWYFMQRWSKSGSENSQAHLKKFGDEARTFHRMRLKYEAATHQTTGYVDGNPVATIDFEFRSPVRFVLALTTDKKGNDVDLCIDHATLSLGGKTIEFGSTGPTGEMP